MGNFRVEERSRNVHDIIIPFQRNKSWYRYVLLTADRHFDNPKSNRKLQFEHLKEAQERDAPVIDLGDFFCLMQGRFDPRKNKSDILPQHNVSDYLDAVISEAEEMFAPYAEQFAVIGYGNHETKILKHQETDVIKRFMYRMNRHNPNMFAGDYGGWVRFRFNSESGNTRQDVKLKYFHGSGGGGPVTKGVIQTNRRAVYLPDADIVATGHIHESWQLAMCRERISSHGNIYLDEQLHICCPTYKEEYGDGGHGWHIERGAPPKPVGAVWLKFFYRDGNIKYVAERAS